MGALLFALPLYADCMVKDDTDQAIRLSHPAHRIISLAPDITENLFAIGAGVHIIGVIAGSDYPKAALKLPIVGSYAGLDLERIASLKPDLIVAWQSGSSKQLDALRQLGIPVYITHSQSLMDVARSMENLGCLAGTSERAQHVAMAFRRALRQLENRYQRQSTVSVFYQIGTSTLITINHESWINQAIEKCGGRNIFANAKTLVVPVDWETVLTYNPAAIINSTLDPSWKQGWQRWGTLQAVHHHALFTLDPDLINRAGPRLVIGLEKLCNFLDLARTSH